MQNGAYLFSLTDCTLEPQLLAVSLPLVTPHCFKGNILWGNTIWFSSTSRRLSRCARIVVVDVFATLAISCCVSQHPCYWPVLYRQAAAKPCGWHPIATPASTAIVASSSAQCWTFSGTASSVASRGRTVCGLGTVAGSSSSVFIAVYELSSGPREHRAYLLIFSIVTPSGEGSTCSTTIRVFKRCKPLWSVVDLVLVDDQPTLPTPCLTTLCHEATITVQTCRYRTCLSIEAPAVRVICSHELLRRGNWLITPPPLLGSQTR